MKLKSLISFNMFKIYKVSGLVLDFLQLKYLS